MILQGSFFSLTLEMETAVLVPNGFHAAFGTGLEWKPEHEILELAERINGRGPRHEIFAACGTEDPFRGDNKHFAEAMAKLDFVYEEWKGSRDWTFFNHALEKALGRFLSGTRQGNPLP